jgi:alpha-L-fucosidase
MKCPKDGAFLIRSLKNSEDQNVPEFHGIIEQVDVLGFTGTVEWSVDGDGLHVSAPGINSDFPVVVRVKIK